MMGSRLLRDLNARELMIKGGGSLIFNELGLPHALLGNSLGHPRLLLVLYDDLLISLHKIAKVNSILRELWSLDLGCRTVRWRKWSGGTILLHLRSNWCHCHVSHRFNTSFKLIRRHLNISKAYRNRHWYNGLLGSTLTVFSWALDYNLRHIRFFPFVVICLLYIFAFLLFLFLSLFDIYIVRPTRNFIQIHLIASKTIAN